MYGDPKPRARERNRMPASLARPESAPTQIHTAANGAGSLEEMFAYAPVTDVPEATDGVGPSTRIGHLCFLLQHLRDRKVVQWMLAYVGATWMVLESMDVLSEIWGWPPNSSGTLMPVT